LKRKADKAKRVEAGMRKTKVAAEALLGIGAPKKQNPGLSSRER